MTIIKRYNAVAAYHLLLFIFTLVSCANQKADFIFNRVEHIVVDTIPMQRLFFPTFMTLAKDVLLVTSYGSGDMLHFYNVPELTYLYSTSGQGKGPNEFQAFPMICKTYHLDNKLFLWGYTPLTIKEWEVKNNFLSLNRTYTLNQYEDFNQLHIAQDSLFIYKATSGNFSIIKKYNLIENKETGKIALKMDEHKQPSYSLNYGYIAVNDSLIVYIYYYRRQFDIYEISSINLVKQITGIYKQKPVDLNDFNSNVQHYANIVAGKKYFYALYLGIPRKDRTVNNDVIEVFDYEGNPIVRYTFNITPQIFVIDENNKMLYGFSYFYQDYLLRCNLPHL